MNFIHNAKHLLIERVDTKPEDTWMVVKTQDKGA